MRFSTHDHKISLSNFYIQIFIGISHFIEDYFYMRRRTGYDQTFPNQAKVTPNGYYTKLSKIPWTQDAGTDETKGYETMQRFTTEIRPLTGWKINADYTFRSYTSKFTSNNFICYEDMVDGTLVPLGTTVPSYVEKNQQNNFYSSF